MTETFPPRLHVLLAPRASRGLVIRRGPSKQVATFLWNLQNDTFELGQWLKGRIYERRCDLSPDGRHWIYFAMNGHWAGESKGSWTALARAPWLKAMTFMPKGDCWHGGGLFLTPFTYWVNDGWGHDVKIESRVLRRDRQYEPPAYYGGECTGVYYVRLQRDGWTMFGNTQTGRYGGVTHFEKTLPHGWRLRKLAHEALDHPPGRGCYWDEHELISPQNRTHPRRNWQWADFADNRLLWAENGKLFAAPVRSAMGPAPAVELRDFSADQFAAIAAPY